MEDNFTENSGGQLFESIEFKNQSDVRNLINNLNLEQSIFLINKCIEYTHSKGAFSLLESEIISKSLSIVNSKILITNSSTEPNTDNS